MAMQVVEANSRETRGKNAARRLRRDGWVPAVLYGAKKDPVAIAVNPKLVNKILESESGHNTIFTLEIDGKTKTNAMIKDWLVDPVRGDLLHVDLIRIAMHEKLRVKVPIVARGEPRGVKEQGGVFEYVMREVEVECLPTDIPDNIPVNVSELLIGQRFRAADIQVDPKLRVVTDPDRTLCHVVALAVVEEKPAEVEVAAPAEPEVIKKGKAVEEGEEVEEEEGGEK